MWHKPEPIEMKIVLFDAIYGSHPKDLIEHLNLQSTRTHITQHNYMRECLMSERGISTHAVAFYGQDHIDNYGDDSFNQEVRFFDLVKQGVMKYVIDHSIFCHHINYHSVRDLVQKKSELVSVFHKRLFEYYEEKMSKTPHKVTTRSKVVHASHDGANVCVTIGWYSDSNGGKRNAHTLAPQLFEPNYLNDTLIPRIQKQIDPRIILIHSSQCEIPPDPVPFGHNIEVVHGYRKAKRNTTAGQPPYAIGGAHDWGATMMTGAQYAYCNDLDFIFYEQDCLVHNFTKVLEIAEGKSIVYGYGKNSSYGDGWAEPSLTFVSNEFLPEFINRLNKGKWHQWTEGFARFKHPEIQFHNTFADVAEYWPFGYGMKRPINFKDEVYFAQRFIEDDFLNFLKHSQV